MNIARNLERARLFFPDKPALIFEGQSYTYRQIDEEVNRLANGLRSLGLEKGDRVALFLPNIPAFVLGYFAVQKLGAVAVSVNVMLKKDEVTYILNDAAAKVLFTAAEQRAEVSDKELPNLTHVIIVEGEASGKDIAITDLMSRGEGHFKTVEADRHDPAAILYTSGTTGFPKGATLTQLNINSNAYSTVHHVGIRSEDRLHLFLPLFHCFGQNFILNSGVCAGAAFVMHRRFEPNPVSEAICRDKVTMFIAVPTIFTYFLNMNLPAKDLSSLRYCFTAAATMPKEIARRWKESFGMTIYEGYGLTECSPFASYNHDFQHRFGSIGMPLENIEMKITDEEGNETPVGEWGEILIKGPNVMKGYWNKPEATAEAIREGWLRSGDIGTKDEDGYFYIVDRVKDMINAAGFNVYPAEVEQVLYKHPAVREAAVFGASDPVRGETVHAAVVLKDGISASAEEIVEFCRTNIAAYKVPRKVELVEQLPKSATGKILKRVLRGDK